VLSTFATSIASQGGAGTMKIDGGALKIFRQWSFRIGGVSLRAEECRLRRTFLSVIMKPGIGVSICTDADISAVDRVLLRSFVLLSDRMCRLARSSASCLVSDSWSFAVRSPSFSLYACQWN
jgi:hypothetical protein